MEVAGPCLGGPGAGQRVPSVLPAWAPWRLLGRSPSACAGRGLEALGRDWPGTFAESRPGARGRVPLLRSNALRARSARGGVTAPAPPDAEVGSGRPAGVAVRDHGGSAKRRPRRPGACAAPAPAPACGAGGPGTAPASAPSRARAQPVGAAGRRALPHRLHFLVLTASSGGCRPSVCRPLGFLLALSPLPTSLRLLHPLPPEAPQR